MLGFGSSASIRSASSRRTDATEEAVRQEKVRQSSRAENRDHKGHEKKPFWYNSNLGLDRPNNQPSNQPTNQPANQPTNPSINPAIDHINYGWTPFRLYSWILLSRCAEWAATSCIGKDSSHELNFESQATLVPISPCLYCFSCLTCRSFAFP